MQIFNRENNKFSLVDSIEQMSDNSLSYWHPELNSNLNTKPGTIVSTSVNFNRLHFWDVRYTFNL